MVERAPLKILADCQKPLNKTSVKPQVNVIHIRVILCEVKWASLSIPPEGLALLWLLVCSEYSTIRSAGAT